LFDHCHLERLENKKNKTSLVLFAHFRPTYSPLAKLHAALQSIPFLKGSECPSLHHGEPSLPVAGVQVRLHLYLTCVDFTPPPRSLPHVEQGIEEGVP
jgi:hypothetical protein